VGFHRRCFFSLFFAIQVFSRFYFIWSPNLGYVIGGGASFGGGQVRMKVINSPKNGPPNPKKICDWLSDFSIFHLLNNFLALFFKSDEYHPK